MAYSNAESKFHWQRIRNPVPGVWNLQRGIENPRLSWVPLYGAIYKIPKIDDIWAKFIVSWILLNGAINKIPKIDDNRAKFILNEMQPFKAKVYKDVRTAELYISK